MIFCQSDFILKFLCYFFSGANSTIRGRRFFISSNIPLYVYVCFFCGVHLKFKSFTQSFHQQDDLKGDYPAFINLMIDAHGVCCAICKLKIGDLRNRKRIGRCVRIFKFRVMRIEPKDVCVVCDPHANYEKLHSHKYYSIFVENKIDEEFVVPRYVSVRNDVLIAGVCPHADILNTSTAEKMDRTESNECVSVASFVRIFLSKLETVSHSSKGIYSMEGIQKALLDSHFEHVATDHGGVSEQVFVLKHA